MHVLAAAAPASSIPTYPTASSPAVAVREIFNFGSEESVTINHLAQLARRLAGRTVQTVHVPYDEAYGPEFEDARYRVPDIGKLRTLLGSRPTKHLDDILVEVIAYFRGANQLDEVLEAKE
jgi:UDP-glucose 4-epimerase